MLVNGEFDAAEAAGGHTIDEIRAGQKSFAVDGGPPLRRFVMHIRCSGVVPGDVTPPPHLTTRADTPALRLARHP